MNKQHLPYNILLVIAVVAVALMAVCNLGLRQSSFAVTVGYEIPRPVDNPAPAPEPPPRGTVQEPLPRHEAEAEPVQSPAVSVRFPLNLNEATYSQLLFIPGVGDVTAQRIVQYRDVLGGYTRMSQLLEIKGIGEATYRDITAYLYLESQDPGTEADLQEYSGVSEEEFGENETDDYSTQEA